MNLHTSPSHSHTQHTYKYTQSVNDLIGSDTETGGVWDPLGLSQNEAALRKYRESELKHGRTAMLGKFTLCS